MTKIDVTLMLNTVDLGDEDEDEELGGMVDADYYFVIKGIPQEHHATFFEKIGEVKGLSEREPKKNDGKLRINWSRWIEKDRRDEITEVIQSICPNANVRHRTLGSVTSSDEDSNWYDNCALTEDECDALRVPFPHHPS